MLVKSVKHDLHKVRLKIGDPCGNRNAKRSLFADFYIKRSELFAVFFYSSVCFDKLLLSQYIKQQHNRIL